MKPLQTPHKCDPLTTPLHYDCSRVPRKEQLQTHCSTCTAPNAPQTLNPKPYASCCTRCATDTMRMRRLEPAPGAGAGAVRATHLKALTPKTLSILLRALRDGHDSHAAAGAGAGRGRGRGRVGLGAAAVWQGPRARQLASQWLPAHIQAQGSVNLITK